MGTTLDPNIQLSVCHLAEVLGNGLQLEFEASVGKTSRHLQVAIVALQSASGVSRVKDRIISIAFEAWTVSLARSLGQPNQKNAVNSELCRLALIKVGNPNVLVNLVSRRVRQLNSGGGPQSRPLFHDTVGLGAADIALREIIEEKMGWDLPEEAQLVEPAPKKRRKSSS
ncbi:MAG: hypothetical protein QOF48_2642 [Verrucomicrobiota bacterium]